MYLLKYAMHRTASASAVIVQKFEGIFRFMIQIQELRTVTGPKYRYGQEDLGKIKNAGTGTSSGTRHRNRKSKQAPATVTARRITEAELELGRLA